MHEMGIALQIIEISKASIPPDMKDVRVEKINLKVGKLSAVVADSLRFCFDIATRDTRFSGAELVIEEIPVVLKCRDCDKSWTIEQPVFTCKYCNSGTIDILSGRELDIVSIEVEDRGDDQVNAG